MLWTSVYKFLGGWTCFHFSWVSNYRSGITGSYGNSMFTFLTNCQTVLNSSCSILYFTHHQQCKGSTFSASSSTLTVCIFDYSHLVWNGTSLRFQFAFARWIIFLPAHWPFTCLWRNLFAHFVFLLLSPHFLRGQKREGGRNFSGNRRDLD